MYGRVADTDPLFLGPTQRHVKLPMGKDALRKINPDSQKSLPLALVYRHGEARSERELISGQYKR